MWGFLISPSCCFPFVSVLGALELELGAWGLVHAGQVLCLCFVLRQGLTKLHADVELTLQLSLELSTLLPQLHQYLE